MNSLRKENEAFTGEKGKRGKSKCCDSWPVTRESENWTSPEVIPFVYTSYFILSFSLSLVFIFHLIRSFADSFVLPFILPFFHSFVIPKCVFFTAEIIAVIWFFFAIRFLEWTTSDVEITKQLMSQQKRETNCCAFFYLFWCIHSFFFLFLSFLSLSKWTSLSGARDENTDWLDLAISSDSERTGVVVAARTLLKILLGYVPYCLRFSWDRSPGHVQTCLVRYVWKQFCNGNSSPRCSWAICCTEILLRFFWDSPPTLLRFLPVKRGLDAQRFPRDPSHSCYFATL